MCSSSGGQLYEYNFWYNHSVLVAVQYAGQDILTCIPDDFADLTKNHCRDGIMTLDHRWNKYISLKGDYVEK